MCARAWAKSSYLSLDELRADPTLARLLPLDVAYRFHALPIAEQGGRITVVMADPEDPEALSAIADVLGREPCVVQGDMQTIDASLARVWGQAPHTRLRLVVCAAEAPEADGLVAYAHLLAELLNAEVKQAGCGGGLETLAGRPGRPPGDLLLVGEEDSPLVGPWLQGTRLREVPSALLVAPRPRWPLARILLIVRGEEADAAAVDWALRLALPRASVVNVLAVVPPLAALHEQRRAASSGHARDRQGLPALLSAGTRPGHELQEVAHRLEEQEIRGSVRMRQGPREWQIRRELAEEEHDLVVMAQRPGKDGQGGSGELAAALLRWSECPTLIARPA